MCREGQSCQHLESFARRSMMVNMLAFSSSLLDRIEIVFVSLYIYIFLLYFSFHWSTVSGCIWITVHFMYIKYYFFVTSKTSFVQLKNCMFLTDENWAVWSCGVSTAKPGSPLSSSCASTPLCYILYLHFPRLLLLYQPCVSLHYVSVLES